MVIRRRVEDLKREDAEGAGDQLDRANSGKSGKSAPLDSQPRADSKPEAEHESP